ncbi:Rho GTPase-activating protein 39 [Trichinella murrelli]|uniref:Nitrilase and fragile histidine triad fusion protein NitFhit n=1 Tax=Trichinella murrelli TaxID=144512 RepID=A0A0V0UF10_9BILA|nr:Rho GTPase-activating protein 39 [Trichinella murrelli]
MADSQIEWVEIVEPQTREHMYANLITGECAWDPPPGARIKKTHENQWWELYDQNTGRFYYYNASTQKTVWQRPYNCDIIPLAKLQTLKQNTEARHRTSAARQQHASPVQMELRGNVVLYDEPLFSVPNESINSPCTTASSLSPHSSRSSTQTSTTTRRPETKTVSCQTQTSPITSPKARKRVNKTKGCQTALSASHLVKKHSHRTGGGRSRSRSRRNVAISAEPEDSIQEALIVSLNKEKRSADFRNTKETANERPVENGIENDRPSAGSSLDRCSSSSCADAATTNSRRFDPMIGSMSSYSLQMNNCCADSHRINVEVGKFLRRHDSKLSSCHRVDELPPNQQFCKGSSSTPPRRRQLDQKQCKASASCLDSSSSFVRSFLAQNNSSTTITTTTNTSTGTNTSNTKNAAVPVPAVRQSLKLHSEQSQRSNLGNLSRQRSFDFACNFNQLRLHGRKDGTKLESGSEDEEEEEDGDSTATTTTTTTANNNTDEHANEVDKEEEEMTVDDGQAEEIQLGEEVSEDKNSMVMKNYGASNNTINAAGGGGKSAKKVSLKTANVCHSKARVVPATASMSGSPQIWQAIDNSSTCTAGTAVWKSHDSGIKSGDSGARGDDSSSAASVESPRFGHLDGSQSAGNVFKSSGTACKVAKFPVSLNRPVSPNVNKIPPPQQQQQQQQRQTTPRMGIAFVSSIAPAYEHVTKHLTYSQLHQQFIVGDSIDQFSEREVEESSSSSSNDDSAPDDDDDEGLFADDEEGGPPSPVSLSSQDDDDDDDDDNAIDDKNEVLVSQSCLSSKKYLLPTMGVSQRFFDPDDSRLRVIYDTPDTPSKESKSITPHDCADPLLLDSVLYRRRSSDAGNFSTPKLNATVGSCSNNSMAEEEEESGSTKRALKNVVEKPARSSMNGFVSTAADLSPNQYRPQSVLMSGHQEHYLAPTNLIPNHSSTLNRLNKAECTRTTTTSGPMHHHHQQQQQQQLLRLKESDGVELYPHEYLNRHKKGLFGKRQSVQSMLSWTRAELKKPLIMTVDKAVKKEAREIFKRIQAYMGDRKVKKSTITVDMLALDVCVRGWAKPALRDEIFIQLCKQTTENPRPESVRRGWELMSICLKFFPPSSQFTSYLDTYICRYADPVLDLPEVSVSHYAQHCCKRLERILRHGARRGLRKPTIEEVEQARLQIFHPSMFGNTLDEVMVIQRERFTGRKLPWIQTTLSELVLQLNGAKTEGIFRVPGDIDEVNALKMRIDRWLLPPVADPHIPASLLKLWYRELADPLVPDCLYQECIQTVDEPLKSCEIADRLPSINRLVLAYLIRFLQIFIRPENVAHTKMDSSNLAMVMAPNCLRCQSDDPTVIFDNTRKEMTFLRNLMEHYDTSFVDGSWRGLKLNFLRNYAFNRNPLLKFEKLVPWKYGSLSLSHNSRCTFSVSCIQYHRSLASLESSKSNGSQPDKKADVDESKLTTYQKFKLTFKRYWYVLVPVHLITSSVWLGSFYYLAVSGVDLVGILESMGFSEQILNRLKQAPRAGNIALAYAMFKIVTPLRYTATIGVTAVSVKYLVRMGLIKPAPSKEQVKRFVEQKRFQLRERYKVESSKLKGKWKNISKISSKRNRLAAVSMIRFGLIKFQSSRIFYSSMPRSTVAICQTLSTDDKQHNWKQCESLIRLAKTKHAQMIFLPECFDYVAASKSKSIELAEKENGVYINQYRMLARELKVWLSLGGFHEKSEDSDVRVYNTHLIIDDHGNTVTKYRKVHLFDVDIPGEKSIRESSYTIAGNNLQLPVQTPIGRLFVSTCYDIRFPELACLARQFGAEVLCYPSAFTVSTGMAHWEVLVRSRAIDSQCFVIAAAQCGKHNDKRSSYGRAMVVDPWGTVLAQCSTNTPSLAVCDLDLDFENSVRKQFPTQNNRRTDLYQLLSRVSPFFDIDSISEYPFAEKRIPSSCVFYRSEHCYAFVNLKPVVEGHTLVSPLRPVQKLSQLNSYEIADLFNCVQLVESKLAKFYKTSSSTVCIQDGPEAGQTVKHLHVHILPRKRGDFEHNDEIYSVLDRHDKEVAEKSWRSLDEMNRESATYRELFNG